MESDDQSYLFRRSVFNGSLTTKLRPRQCFSFREIDPDGSIEYDDSFEELVKKTWTVWGVSSLFGFEYNEKTKMKAYAKKLREEVSRCLSKEGVSYTSKFMLMSDFGPQPNPTDAPAIQIELIAESGTTKVCVYRGFLISWRTDLIESINENCVNLPLLFCKGTSNTIKAVHSVMSRMFDCIVTPLPITDYDLKWLTTINVYAKSNKGRKDSVLLEYLVPEFPNTDAIQIYFQSKDLKKLWETVCTSIDENVQTIRTEHVDKLFRIIENQMLIEGGLQLGLCTLHRLSLPSLSIAGNRLKVMNPETLNTLLLFLNDIALELLYSLNCSKSRVGSSRNNSSADVSDAGH